MKLLLHDLARKVPSVDFSKTVPVVFCDTGDGTIFNEGKIGKPNCLPFKCMAFEMVERYPILDCMHSPTEDGNLHVYCYHTTEVAPERFEIILLCKFEKQSYLSVLKVTQNKGAIYDPFKKRWCDDNYSHSYKIYSEFAAMSTLFLDRMYDRKMQRGTTKPRSTMVGKGRNRRKCTPKDCIVIGPANDYIRISKEIGQPVQWDHSWRVSGHWRRLPEGTRIKGKDREGNRTVEGLTWVPEHIKGDGPEIIKTRIVI